MDPGSLLFKTFGGIRVRGLVAMSGSGIRLGSETLPAATEERRSRKHVGFGSEICKQPLCASGSAPSTLHPKPENPRFSSPEFRVQGFGPRVQEKVLELVSGVRGLGYRAGLKKPEPCLLCTSCEPEPEKK